MRKAILGIDEAGRGPFAGPLFASAVFLPKDHQIKGLMDSKVLSEAKREELYDLITENAYFYIAKCSAAYIDKHGLSKACKEVFKKSYQGFKKKYPDIEVVKLEIDGRDNFDLGIDATYIIKGDSKVEAISAASILAKVSRDRYMLKMAKKYPLYCFETHKGYGTRSHRDLLLKHGPCEIHRKSFKPIKELL